MATFLTNAQTPLASGESLRCWERDVGGYRNVKRPGDAFSLQSCPAAHLWGGHPEGVMLWGLIRKRILVP